MVRLQFIMVRKKEMILSQFLFNFMQRNEDFSASVLCWRCHFIVWNYKYHKEKYIIITKFKFRVFWGILPCSQIDIDRRFRGAPTHLPLAHFLTCRNPFTIDQSSSLDFYIASYLFAQGYRPDDGGSAHLWNVVWLIFYYTAEDSELHTRCRGNLKSRIKSLVRRKTLRKVSTVSCYIARYWTEAYVQ
jgi:hypothetical protein